MTATPLRKFTAFAFLQFLSTLGSFIFATGLGLWTFGESASVEKYALILILVALPALVILPFSGILADRISPKKLFFVGDFLACLSSVVLLICFKNGFQSTALIYVVTVLNSAFSSLQYPALHKALVLMVPKDEFNRANGVIATLDACKFVVGPFLAAAALQYFAIPGLIAIDVVTFFFSLISLLIIRGLRTEPPAIKLSYVSVVNEWKESFALLKQKQILISLLVFMSIFNGLDQAVIALITPYLLSMTNLTTLGSVLSIVGVGTLASGAIVSLVGNRLTADRAMMLSLISVSALNVALPLFANLWYAAVVLSVSSALVTASLAFSYTSWQIRITADQVGRLSSLRSFVTNLTTPIGYFIAGILCDRFFEPSLKDGGIFSETIVSTLLGTGNGRGTGLLIFVFGAIQLALMIGLYKSLRKDRTRASSIDESAVNQSST